MATAPPPVPPGPGGGSSTTTSTTSSTSTSNAPSGPTPEQIRNAEASFTNILVGWGIPVDKTLEAFVKQAVKSQWSGAEFLRQFRLTKAYALRFPGIMRQDGSMRMTEAQYISGYNSARDYAATLGRSLSPEAYGAAIKGGNSPSEIRAKLSAEDILRSNAQVFGEFSDYLVARGIVSPKGLSKDDLRQFVMGQGPKALEQEWQTAYSAAQLANVGVDVGKKNAGADVSYKTLSHLESRFEALNPGQQVENLGQSFYNQILESAKAIDVGKLYSIGITKKDLLVLAFGGKNVSAVAEKVSRALDTYHAAQDPRANPQLTQGGLQLGSPQTQASE